jgi:putative ABC transport system ATP-binding protein
MDVTTFAEADAAAAANPLIKIARLAKRYKKAGLAGAVFEDLDLTINAGDFIAIMGPSGSGKTTLLNILGGIDRATEGTIMFGGEELSGMSERRLARFRSHHCGYIFQFYNLMPMLNAAQNVELPLLLRGLDRRQRSQRVETALELVGLLHRKRHYPREMSGGEQQRVGIARAIVADPELLLCDEPTGDLDRASANEVLALFRTLNQDLKKTIVMVTHDPEAASQARQVLHLNKGRLANGLELRR